MSTTSKANRNRTKSSPSSDVAESPVTSPAKSSKVGTSPGSIASNNDNNNNNNSSSSTSSSSEEDDLRRKLLSALQSLSRREPLDASYKRLLLSGVVTRKSPVVPKDKFYKRLGSRLRERVQAYLFQMQGKDPFDRISQRKPMEEAAMRAAFTLREAKDYEQQSLLEATLAAKELDPNRKRYLDGIALGLQSRKDPSSKRLRTAGGASASSLGNRSSPSASAKKSLFSSAGGTAGGSPSTSDSKMEQTEQARQKAELERQRAQARKREEARRRREDEERRRKEEELLARKNKQAETPQQALHKAIEPVFRKLWDMEFVNLGGTNPFRIVIDRDNCASIGAADYFDVITTPMNLTYIQEKVNKMQYTSLQSFFADVDLMISNAILYNSDPANPYRIAAEEMKKRHLRIVKKVYQQIQQKKEAAQNKS